MARLRERLINFAKQLSPAAWGLVACSLLTLPGFANAMLQNRASEWRMRLIQGQPLIVRFVCGTKSGLDCHDSYTIFYSKEDSRFCEHVRKNGRTTDPISLCNSDPSRGGLSIEGILYSYDRLGVVKLDSKFVGQLSLP